MINKLIWRIRFIIKFLWLYRKDKNFYNIVLSAWKQSGVSLSGYGYLVNPEFIALSVYIQNGESR